MATDQQASDIEQRAQSLRARGEADFGPERVQELIALGHGPEPESQADDPRSLSEMIWWRDVLALVGDEAMPLIYDFYDRVDSAKSEHGVDNPEDLPPAVVGPLEAEAHIVYRIRQAIASFGYEL